MHLASHRSLVPASPHRQGCHLSERQQLWWL